MKYRIYTNIAGWSLLDIVEKEMINDVLSDISDETELIIVEQHKDMDVPYYGGTKENYYAKKKVKR